ncbi:MAG: glycosyltransferase family 9 protein [Bacteroidales bacterium]|nr:glycosyltransferase family 9 protein [Bacteroidales bacterium]
MDSNYKFLIIRFSSIGDVILTTPLVRCLRAKFPTAQIDFLVKKEFAVVLSGNPHLNNILIFDKNAGKGELRRIRQFVKQNKYSHILDIQKNIRSIFISAGSGAIVSGFSKKLVERDLLIRFGINIYKEIKPVYLRYFESIADLGVEYDGKGTEVFPAASEAEKVTEILEHNQIPLDMPLLVIAPGAQWENKRWPEQGFATASDTFCSQTGAYPVLIGGPGDVEICKQVQTLMKTPSLNLAGKLSLMGSASILSRANMAFTNDTGMLHMAQAMKTSVIAVYGPTTRELGFFPLPENSRVAEIEISCRPCTQKGLHSCPKKHFRCMKDLKPEMVSDLAIELIINKAINLDITGKMGKETGFDV